MRNKDVQAQILVLGTSRFLIPDGLVHMVKLHEKNDKSPDTTWNLGQMLLPEEYSSAQTFTRDFSIITTQTNTAKQRQQEAQGKFGKELVVHKMVGKQMAHIMEPGNPGLDKLDPIEVILVRPEKFSWEDCTRC